MSYCKLDSERFGECTDGDIDDSVYNAELLFCMKNMAGQVVSKEEYWQLLFVLGFKEYNFEAITQDYKVILTLFNSFDQSSKNSIKDWINQFQFSFEYDETISEADNRLLFKDFFA